MSRPMTPASGAHATGSVRGDESASARPALSGSRQASHLSSGAPGTSGLDHSQGLPNEGSMLSEAAAAHDEGIEPGQETTRPDIQRSDSRMSQSQPYTPSRSGTLKKRASLKRVGSMGRSTSRRSSYAGSVRSLKLGDGEKPQGEDNNSVFYCPVPTSGNPTELLANRFQAWRKVLKDLINYFRELSKGYELRSKYLLSASNVINSTIVPGNFLNHGGLGDALSILRDFHKQALAEASKARNVEDEIVMQLTGLRSDLQQKIKEIKNLSGDFKNSVDKEIDATKRMVRAYQDSLGLVDHDPAATSGKGDPFIIKLGVDRQVEKQLEEENYLHRAYLNLENSGRELESIVVGEIQKAYNAYAGILKREADEAYETTEKLREGPLAMPKDFEWDRFTTNNSQMVDPRLPVRTFSKITYPGKDHPAAIEVRSGMLERKSKYLKNYTPGWYILSPTHLHEFKSADRIEYQNPVMSLYLPEQKLGSHSDPGSSSQKFMLKGRQTGSMHRGHAWVFRAESHDTMMAWYSDIKELVEKTGEARNDFVRRQHARSLSGNSLKAASIGGGSSNDGMEEDEADHVPFSSEQSVRGPSVSAEAGGIDTAASGGAAAVAIGEIEDNRSEAGWRPPQRPSPGGRFPSDVNVQRGLQAPNSPSSGEISDAIHDRETMMAASTLPGSGIPFSNSTQRHTDLQPAEAPSTGNDRAGPAGSASAYQAAPITPTKPIGYQYGDFRHGGSPISGTAVQDNTSQYGEWMAPLAAGAGGAALGAAAGTHYYHNREEQPQPQSQATTVPAAVAATTHSQPPVARDPDRPVEIIDNVNRQMEDSSAVPAHGTSSPPIPVDDHQPLTAGFATGTGKPATTIEPERSLSRPRGVTESTQATSATGMTASTLVSGVDARIGHGTASSVGDRGSLSTVPTSVDDSATTPNLNNEAIFEKGHAAAIAEPVLPSEFSETTPTTTPNGDEMRPKPFHSKSVTTISELHVPGEFPRPALA